ncbi:hypothetical protein AB0L06_33155 [Spirillospora sp. NPDC052269]
MASGGRASGGQVGAASDVHWLSGLPAEVFVEAEAGPGQVLFSVPLIPLRPPSVPVEFDTWLEMRHWYRALRDLADQDLALVTGLLSWRPPDGPPVRGHLLSTPVEIVVDDRTERVDVIVAGPTTPLDHELLADVPGYQPGRAAWVWDAVQAGQGFALRASVSDVLRKWCTAAFATDDDPAFVYRDDWAPGGQPGEIPAVRLAPALVVRQRPRGTGLAAHYDQLISSLADPPPDGLVRFLAADLLVLHVPDPEPNAAARMLAGMTAQGRRVLVVRPDTDTGGIPPRPDLPEVPPLTDGEAAELLRLLTQRTLAPPADTAALPDPNRIRALVNVERAVPPEASGEVARRLRQFDPAVLTRLTGRVAQVDGILNELGLGGHPSRWPGADPAARAFADILARRNLSAWDRVAEMAVQADRAQRALRSLRGHRVVLPPDVSARDLADAAHELRAHLLTGGTLKRGPMRSAAQRKAEPLLATVTVDGQPPNSLPLLETALTHLTAEITCQDLHYAWEAAGIPFRPDLPLTDRAARFTEAHARLARVRILTPVLTEVAELGIPLTHPLQWHGLTIGLAAAHLASEADRASAALTHLRDAVDPSLTDVRATLDARDPDAYARALHALADSHRIRTRRDALLGRLHTVHPDLAARMTADPSAFTPLARTWTTSWSAARGIDPDAVPLWDVPAAIPVTPDSLDAIILDGVHDAGPEALFLLWYTPRVILLGRPGEDLAPLDAPRPPLPPDLHDSLAPTTPLYKALLSRALETRDPRPTTSDKAPPRPAEPPAPHGNNAPQAPASAAPQAPASAAPQAPASAAPQAPASAAPEDKARGERSQRTASPTRGDGPTYLATSAPTPPPAPARPQDPDRRGNPSNLETRTDRHPSPDGTQPTPDGDLTEGAATGLNESGRTEAPPHTQRPEHAQPASEAVERDEPTPEASGITPHTQDSARPPAPTSTGEPTHPAPAEPSTRPQSNEATPSHPATASSRTQANEPAGLHPTSTESRARPQGNESAAPNSASTEASAANHRDEAAAPRQEAPRTKTEPSGRDPVPSDTDDDGPAPAPLSSDVRPSVETTPRTHSDEHAAPPQASIDEAEPSGRGRVPADVEDGGPAPASSRGDVRPHVETAARTQGGEHTAPPQEASRGEAEPPGRGHVPAGAEDGRSAPASSRGDVRPRVETTPRTQGGGHAAPSQEASRGVADPSGRGRVPAGAEDGGPAPAPARGDVRSSVESSSRTQGGGHAAPSQEASRGVIAASAAPGARPEPGRHMQRAAAGGEIAEFAGSEAPPHDQARADAGRRTSAEGQAQAQGGEGTTSSDERPHDAHSARTEPSEAADPSVRTESDPRRPGVRTEPGMRTGPGPRVPGVVPSGGIARGSEEVAGPASTAGSTRAGEDVGAGGNRHEPGSTQGDAPSGVDDAEQARVAVGEQGTSGEHGGAAAEAPATTSEAAQPRLPSRDRISVGDVADASGGAGASGSVTASVSAQPKMLSRDENGVEDTADAPPREDAEGPATNSETAQPKLPSRDGDGMGDVADASRGADVEGPATTSDSATPKTVSHDGIGVEDRAGGHVGADAEGPASTADSAQARTPSRGDSSEDGGMDARSAKGQQPSGLGPDQADAGADEGARPGGHGHAQPAPHAGDSRGAEGPGQEAAPAPVEGGDREHGAARDEEPARGGTAAQAESAPQAHGVPGDGLMRAHGPTHSADAARMQDAAQRDAPARVQGSAEGAASARVQGSVEGDAPARGQGSVEGDGASRVQGLVRGDGAALGRSSDSAWDEDLARPGEGSGRGEGGVQAGSAKAAAGDAPAPRHARSEEGTHGQGPARGVSGEGQEAAASAENAAPTARHASAPRHARGEGRDRAEGPAHGQESVRSEEAASAGGGSSAHAPAPAPRHARDQGAAHDDEGVHEERDRARGDGDGSAEGQEPPADGDGQGEAVPAVRIEPGRSIVSYARADLRILVERLLRAAPGLSEDEVVARATRLLACPPDETELVGMRIRYALHERG